MKISNIIPLFLFFATASYGHALVADGITAGVAVTTSTPASGAARFGTTTTTWQASKTASLNFTVGGSVIASMRPDGSVRVANTLLAKEVRVTATPFADYVFGKDYVLMPLPQVEAAIKRDGHLPNMPSGKEIDRDGMPVSAIMVKQMEKIEELTLYMIDANKKNEALERENADMKRRLLALEEAIKSKSSSP